ncbi:hypothetical protein BDW42DRAFT_166457 [Aspergillus taichungensis]|uniref:Uncharacterized protein n=1 Tax=Aspergillus taichungensis TaxID=482145 RepID=A0A2J5HYD8_9EURO|nr:hypothetical protein BDW42DRAFT_166457 [Aspergillus taichungensis]
MTYKTNYEPYTNRSVDTNMSINTGFDTDSEMERTSEEILYPLGSLYPHVVALQLQADENPWSRSKIYAGYHDSNYWSDISVPNSPSSEHFNKPSDSTAGRFVSRIRRFLSRDDLKRRQRS